MPPLGDCQPIPSVSRFIDTLLSTSIHSICTFQDEERMGSPVEQYTQPRTQSDHGILDVSDEMYSPATAKTSRHPYMHSQSLPANLKSFRNRKPSGLSITPHDLSTVDTTKASSHAPIYCARNVEMRRKSLHERHFFRPVSEDDESASAMKA